MSVRSFQPGVVPVFLCLVSVSIGFAQGTKSKVQPPGADVLVRVDGAAITKADLDRLLMSRRVPEKRRAELEPVFLEQLIDQQLMQTYLASRKVEADPAEVERQVSQILKLAASGGDPKAKMAELGYTEESLRAEVALPLAWARYVARVVTEEQIAQHFAESRERFDGTQVRASQILIKAPLAEKDPQAAKSAQEELGRLREEIIAGKVTFAEAAKEHSQAPSAAGGGDVGFFAWRGKMPEAFSRVAFALAPGEVSEPFTTPFGVHLCVVTQRKPGQLSLEDARSDVLESLSRQLWEETLAGLRRRGKIERVRK